MTLTVRPLNAVPSTAQVNVMVDAVTSTLDQNRGDWGGGVFYGGAYQIDYKGVKRGGKNFLQTATVTFDVQISSS